MAVAELLLDFEGESPEQIRVVDRLVEVGDALEVEGDVWLVLRECAAKERSRAAFLCRRALLLSEESRRLVLENEELRGRLSAP